MGLKIPELLFLLVIALIFFGPKKLPEIGKAIGSAVTEFKKGLGGMTGDMTHDSMPQQSHQTIETPQPKPIAQTPVEDPKVLKPVERNTGGPIC